MNNDFRNDTEVAVGSPFQYATATQLSEVSPGVASAMNDVASKRLEEARRREVARVRSKLGMRHVTTAPTPKNKVLERMHRVHPSYAGAPTCVQEPAPTDGAEAAPVREAKRRKKKCDDVGTVNE